MPSMSDDRALGAEEPCVAVRYMLDADPCPGLLPRLLAPFARRHLIPDRMWSHRADAAMHVEIAMHAMPEALAHMVEGNLRQVVGVRSVAQVRAVAALIAA